MSRSQEVQLPLIVVEELETPPFRCDLCEKPVFWLNDHGLCIDCADYREPA